MGKKDYNKAKKAWEIALKQNPFHRQAWANTIILLDELGQQDEAKNAAEEAILYIPNDPLIHYHIGNILGKEESYKKAEYHFKVAISQDPSNAVFYTNLGISSYFV